MMKHPGVAEPVIERLGQPAVRALEAVGPRNARRLGMMADEASPEMLGVIARYGDPAMEFVWRHKAVLAGGAALAAFLANPEPYIDGTNELAATMADATVRPVAEAAGDVVRQSSGEVAREATSLMRWGAALAVAGGAAGALWLARWRLLRALLRRFRRPPLPSLR
ncbi:MAG: hypothetical protein U0835_00615 [Isosphaeraceae bacterium]